MTYHLNLKWKLIILGCGVLFLLFGLGAFVSLFPSDQTESDIWPPLVIGLIFLFMGLEMIYEGINTKIELQGDEIIYYQSRYTFSASWHDLQGITPSPGLLVLTFSNPKEVDCGLVYKVLKSINMHSGLAINYYLTNENKKFIQEKIIAGKNITDKGEIALVNQMLQP